MRVPLPVWPRPGDGFPCAHCPRMAGPIGSLTNGSDAVFMCAGTSGIVEVSTPEQKEPYFEAPLCVLLGMQDPPKSCSHSMWTWHGRKSSQQTDGVIPKFVRGAKTRYRSPLRFSLRRDPPRRFPLLAIMRAEHLIMVSPSGRGLSALPTDLVEDGTPLGALAAPG